MITRVVLLVLILLLTGRQSFSQTVFQPSKSQRQIEAEKEALKEAEETSDPLQDTDPKPPQYLIFEVPNLAGFGPSYHSWFVLRGSLLWTPSGTIDLSKLQWPKWDLNPVPPAIGYVGPNETEVVVFNDQNQQIERISLKKSFSPLLYKAPEGKVPHHFHIELAIKPERVRLISKNYNWPKTKELFHCDVEVIEHDPEKATIKSNEDELVGQAPDDSKSPPLENNPKVKLCMESLHGVAKSAPPGKQWYVDITWPRPLTRHSLMYISENERVFKSALGKNKHVLISRRTEGRNFRASAGLTLIEQLEKPGINTSSLPARDWHGDRPPLETPIKVVGEFPTSDGGKVLISAFASDEIEKRSIDSPVEFNPPINIQFIRASEPNSQVRVTEFREERTGIPGFLRPWFISGSANYHQLKSGRGEELGSSNLPSFEVSWRSPYYNLDPYLTIEPGLFHLGSSLALQEGHVGLRYRWKPHISPSIGYFTYGLRGTNPGSTRLGSIEGIAFGATSTFRVEDYLVRGWINGIYTTPFSYDTYLELSKIIDKGTSDRGVFFGLFFGYTVYRQELQNLVRQLETFSETRIKVGITAGIVGPDFLK